VPPRLSQDVVPASSSLASNFFVPETRKGVFLAVPNKGKDFHEMYVMMMMKVMIMAWHWHAIVRHARGREARSILT